MEEVRIGVVGLGGMGINHIGSIEKSDGIRLVAVCDARKEVVDEQAKKNDVKPFYDFDKMAKSGLIDAVLIATPHYFHTPLAIAAFEAGLHVLTEKPVGVHKADVEKMIAAHDKHPELKFAAMFQMRTGGVWKKLKQLIANGEFGKIKRVNWIITSWYRTQAYFDGGGWRATWKGEGGGVLLNQCPHQLDMFQWLFGMPSKIRANCAIGKYHNIEVEDDVTAFCEYPEGYTGVFITSTGECPGSNRLEIACDRGRVVVEDNAIKFNRTEVPVQEHINTCENSFDTPAIWDVDVPPEKEEGDSPHQRIIANFADAILNGTELIASAEEGINSIELSNSMLYSSLKNQDVELPLDSSAFETLLEDLIKNSTFEKPEEKKQKGDFTKSFNK
ncbi:MAG: Gfo/Idh/MocA family oxidoreductase [Victivallales bacterium]|nr:Gfo/Idh/MocA family oxidoreductase [Victivallales bacterium]